MPKSPVPWTNFNRGMDCQTAHSNDAQIPSSLFTTDMAYPIPASRKTFPHAYISSRHNYLNVPVFPTTTQSVWRKTYQHSSSDKTPACMIEEPFPSHEMQQDLYPHTCSLTSINQELQPLPLSPSWLRPSKYTDQSQESLKRNTCTTVPATFPSLYHMKPKKGCKKSMEIKASDGSITPPPIPPRNDIKGSVSKKPKHELKGISRKYPSDPMIAPPPLPPRTYLDKKILMNDPLDNWNTLQHQHCKSTAPDNSLDVVTTELQHIGDRRKHFHFKSVSLPVSLPDMDYTADFPFKFSSTKFPELDTFQLRKEEMFQDVFPSQTIQQLENHLEETVTKEEASFLEKPIAEKMLFVLSIKDYLPRYEYHRSLLEKLPNVPEFQECQFEECTIIIGGKLSDKDKEIFAGVTTTLSLQKDTSVENHTNVLMVYFYTNDTTKMIQDIKEIHTSLLFECQTILLVMNDDVSDAEQMKIEILETIVATLGKTDVEFVSQSRSMIIEKMTCILEQRLVAFLEQKKMLLKRSSTTPDVRSSLLGVNAILKRIKQSADYPEFLAAEDEDTEDSKINRILQRFGDSILYHGYFGDKLYVITNNQSVKENLDAWYNESGVNIQFVVSVEEKVPTCELSGPWEPLQGVKFVHKSESVEEFHEDTVFATIGGLMEANKDVMVAVTCKHAVRDETEFHVLIEDTVVRLGQELPQPGNKMRRILDDILQS